MMFTMTGGDALDAKTIGAVVGFVLKIDPEPVTAFPAWRGSAR
jgi:hypothetical protein